MKKVRTHLCINKSNGYHNLKEYKTKRTSPSIEVFNDKQSDAIRDKVYQFMYDYEEKQDLKYFKAEQKIEKQLEALTKKQDALYQEKTENSNKMLEEYIKMFRDVNPEFFI